MSIIMDKFIFTILLQQYKQLPIITIIIKVLCEQTRELTHDCLDYV